MKTAAFGIADYKILIETTLSLQARCIYCYLCCYADKKQTAYPSRTRILSELGISKNGYYRHYKQLENSGIIRVERSKCQVNHYMIKTGRAIARSKYGFVYKAVMTNPSLSLTAKVLFVYLTAYCPNGRSWCFKKSQITKELGLSPYKLKHSLRELVDHHLIQLNESRTSLEIRCFVLSSTETNPKSKKEGQADSKKGDTILEKGVHMTSKNEDREESIIYQSPYQSSPIKETDGQTDEKDQLFDSISQRCSDSDCKKHNVCYLVIALIQLQSDQRTMKTINQLLVKHDLSLSDFSFGFLLRYERKSSGIKIKNPIAYMKACLYEFIYHYEYLKDEITCHSRTTYGAAYDIEEYESYSVSDDYIDG